MVSKVLWLIVSAISLVSGLVNHGQEIFCQGTDSKMSHAANKDLHYQRMVQRYTNCTIIVGNLEVTWLSQNMSTDFLTSIREITGYLLVSNVQRKVISLPNLHIIRGRNLFSTQLNGHQKGFSLFVAVNNVDSLELKHLTEISNGNVAFISNSNLCHVNTINWHELLGDTNATVTFNNNMRSHDCPNCHSQCEQGCWGPTQSACQKFNKIGCSYNCFGNRCFGQYPNECCHPSCAGGCSGPTSSDCLACRDFNDNGTCKDECPKMVKYNPSSYTLEPNPDGKYSFGTTCVKECPNYLLKYNGICLKSCPNGTTEKNGECVLCSGPCPKFCIADGQIHSGNVDSFKGCTHLVGNLIILQSSLDGYQEFHPNFTLGDYRNPLDPDLLESLSDIRSVSGYLRIEAYHEKFTNLKYLRNLEIVGGRETTDFQSSIYIIKTSLKYLNLRSLKKINFGDILLIGNANLCLCETINWSKFTQLFTQKFIFAGNASKAYCESQGLVCDGECSGKGCWGPGPSMCISCKSYKHNGECVSRCDESKGLYYIDNKHCGICGEECDGPCPGPNQCLKCKNVQDGPFCKTECPSSKFNNFGNCSLCNELCIDGCTGPLDTIGPGGCKSCEKVIVGGYLNLGMPKCLNVNESCPDGYFEDFIRSEKSSLKSMIGKLACRPCHYLCKNCTNYSILSTVCQCSNFELGKICVDYCPNGYFIQNKTCAKCSNGCSNCNGPEEYDCLACKVFRVYNENKETFSCVDECPYDHPYALLQSNSTEPYCSKLDPFRIFKYFIIIAIIFIILVIIIIMMIHKRKVGLLEKMEEVSEIEEEFGKHGITPNLTQLTIIKENSLTRLSTIGSGAFGTVYKGLWKPCITKNQTLQGAHVAIKVLKEKNEPKFCKSFLDEVYIMASVNHPNILKFIAVCLTKEIMIISQLMPLGCLLDYVRQKKSAITSKYYLMWSTQIADAMVYLEEKRMVHRDLALRNVLLESKERIKITDFGLAKILDVDETVYKCNGGKLPIKWLAPESIKDMVFTHKSDVWSFAVTLWELFTFGSQPFENVPHQLVLTKILIGEKLPQPSICTLDIYLVLLRCWSLEPFLRPSFKELAQTFSGFSNEPTRYIFIQSSVSNPSSLYPQLNYAKLLSDLNQINIDCMKDYATIAPNKSYPSLIYDVPKSPCHLVKNNAISIPSYLNLITDYEETKKDILFSNLEYDMNFSGFSSEK